MSGVTDADRDRAVVICLGVEAFPTPRNVEAVATALADERERVLTPFRLLAGGLHQISTGFTDETSAMRLVGVAYANAADRIRSIAEADA